MLDFWKFRLKTASKQVEEIFFYGHLESSEIENIKLKECAVITINFSRARSSGETLQKPSKVWGR
jgi:hypothetical protein